MIRKLLDKILGAFRAPPATRQEAHHRDAADPPDPAWSYKNGDRLTEYETRIIYAKGEKNGFCPDCQAERLVEGPSGGLSTNYYCLNKRCGSRYNLSGGLFDERITDRSPFAVPDAGPIAPMTDPAFRA